MNVRINGTIPLAHKIARCRCSEATAYRDLNAPTLRGWHYSIDTGIFLCPQCTSMERLPAIVPPAQVEPKPAQPRAGRRDPKVIAERRSALKALLDSGQPLPSERELGRRFGINATVIHFDLRTIRKGGVK